MRPGDWLASVDVARLRRAVLRWYDRNGRTLPWRGETDPYRVWISEIMLQQTTVATVRGYYERFLERFPDIASLAAADESDVLRLWQGLGYYRRARNLWQAARVIVEEHEGVFPSSAEAIQRLPGLGQYTAAAIASFAFGERAGILEANTIRLWTRVCGADGDPTRSPLKKELWDLAKNVLPDRRAGDFNQALMDIGADLCRPREPLCLACPFRDYCEARRLGATDRFPQLPAKREAVDVAHVSVVIISGSKVLLSKRPPEGQWANLWEFPRVERTRDESIESAAARAAASHTRRKIRVSEEGGTLRHGIMHYRVRLDWRWATLADKIDRDVEAEGPNSEWVDANRLHERPLSSPQRRIAKAVAAALATR